MYRFRTSRLVARAVAECEKEAVHDWHAEHYPGMDLELALAVQVKECHTIVIRRREGNISVTVSVLASRPWETETYFFHLQTTGNRVRRVEPKASTAGKGYA